jgi:hypothetical protein
MVADRGGAPEISTATDQESEGNGAAWMQVAKDDGKQRMGFGADAAGARGDGEPGCDEVDDV